jgi:hypothetical protein
MVLNQAAVAALSTPDEKLAFDNLQDFFLLPFTFSLLPCSP